MSITISPHGSPENAVFDEAEFWNSLINEMEAAAFLGMSSRTMQAMRQRGGGPRFVKISARCIRYRRKDLKSWSEARLRNSTSDTEPGSAVA